MTTLIIIIACVFIACVVLSEVKEYKQKEYNYWCKKAMHDFDITEAQFDNYIKFCKEIFNKTSPKLAYFAAQEEWYDINYK